MSPYICSLTLYWAVLLYFLEGSPTEKEEYLHTADNLVYAGIAFLSIGMLLGSLWAKEAWGNYWSWDPKEVWALITLLLYMLPVHTGWLPAFSRDKVLHLYLLGAFFTVLMTYFGVNYFLGGMHSYAG